MINSFIKERRVRKENILNENARKCATNTESISN